MPMKHDHIPVCTISLARLHHDVAAGFGAMLQMIDIHKEMGHEMSRNKSVVFETVYKLLAVAVDANRLSLEAIYEVWKVHYPDEMAAQFYEATVITLSKIKLEKATEAPTQF